MSSKNSEAASVSYTHLDVYKRQEHNSVMRPLHSLEKKGVEVSIVRGDRQGRISPAAIRQAIRPDTKLIVVTAASNVTGTKAPLEEIGRIALRNGIKMCIRDS